MNIPAAHTANVGQNPEYYVYGGMETLVKLAGENSRDHGFHEDWPLEGYPTVTKTGEPASDVRPEEIAAHQRQVSLAIVEKLDLIHEEVSEALGEIRSGHAAQKTYYSSTTKIKDEDGKLIGEETEYHDKQSYDASGKPLLKPEGFGVELADAVIRIADLAYLCGIDLGQLVLEKHEYNKTRPAKHGRKF